MWILTLVFEFLITSSSIKQTSAIWTSLSAIQSDRNVNIPKYLRRQRCEGSKKLSSSPGIQKRFPVMLLLPSKNKIYTAERKMDSVEIKHK